MILEALPRRPIFFDMLKKYHKKARLHFFILHLTRGFASTPSFFILHFSFFILVFGCTIDVNKMICGACKAANSDRFLR